MFSQHAPSISLLMNIPQFHLRGINSDNAQTTNFQCGKSDLGCVKQDLLHMLKDAVMKYI